MYTQSLDEEYTSLGRNYAKPRRINIKDHFGGGRVRSGLQIIYVIARDQRACTTKGLINLAVIREISLWQVDESTGERKPIKDVTIHGGSPLGEGYIVSYKKALEGLIEGGASYSALRIYIKLLSMQTYDAKIIAQNKYLYEQLGICRGAYCKAIKWLEDNHYVKRTTENGINAFILNPAHTACGTKSLKPRAALWSMTAKK